MAKVVLIDVCKEYPGSVRAVQNANLKIEDREFVALVGPSGCGKSTTLRMIAGLEEVTSGTITIGGKVVNNVPPKDRDIAMVFQNYALYPHMTVFDNMAFGLKLRGFPKADIQARVAEAAQILGLKDLLDRKPKALSGGQRQRVAVGRAIVRKPAAFLFDEPLSNLDAKLRVEMRVELNKLHQRLATTMIYVTHDQVEAMTLASRIVIMEKGVIMQVASPLALYERPVNKYVAGFIGSPPMNFFSGRLVRHAGGGISFTDGGAITAPLASETAPLVAAFVDRPVTLGLRPEAIRDKTSAAGWPASAAVTARVEVVESLGNEKIVHFSTEKNSFVARLDAHVPAEVGQKLEVAFNTGKAHIFNSDTGANMTLAPAGNEPA